MHDETYDTIVLGAGIGALTAGAILSQRGEKVLVLERHGKAGGYATPFGRDGITFDVSLHLIGGVYKTRMNTILRQAGIFNDLKFIKPKYLAEVQLSRTKEVIKIPNGEAENFKKQLIQKFPEEKKAINRWFFFMKAFGRQIQLHDSGRNNPLIFALTMLIFPIIAPLLVRSTLNMPKLNWALKTKNKDLQDILLHFSGYYGLPADKINILFPMAANYGYYYDGGYYIEGGGHRICKLLAGTIEKNGGKVLCANTVTQILTNNNRVTGVKTRKDNTAFHAKKIIAGANPVHVYRDLLTNWSGHKNILDKLSDTEIGMTASVLYLAIDIPATTLNPSLKNTYEYIISSPLSESDFYNTFTNQRNFEGDYKNWQIAITFHSHADNTAVPEGITTLDAFFADNYERWAALDRTAYKKQKETETQKMLDTVEQLMPGIRNHLKVVELGTPLTMKRYTNNEKGAIYGFSQRTEQSGFKRFSNKSPLKGLYFASAWTQPGGGYEGSMRSADRLVNPLIKTSGLLWIGLLVLLSVLAKSMTAIFSA